MYKAALFDLDGTLYCKKGLSRRLIRAALRQGGWQCLRLLALERKVRRSLSGKKAGYEELYAGIARRSGKSVEEVQKWYLEWYMAEMIGALEKHYTADAKMIEGVKALKARGVAVGILSDYGCVREKFKALGADPALFDVLLDAPSLGGFKPEPGVFLAACDALGADPSECAMIGDRDDTDGGAVRAGLRYIPVNEFKNSIK